MPRVSKNPNIDRLNYQLENAEKELDNRQQELAQLEKDEEITAEQLAEAERGVNGAKSKVGQIETDLKFEEMRDQVDASGQNSVDASLRDERRNQSTDNIRESHESGIVDPESAQSFEDMPREHYVELAETGKYPQATEKTNPQEKSLYDYESSDMFKVEDMRNEGYASGKGSITTRGEHIYGHHGGDTRAPMETGQPRDAEWNVTREPADQSLSPDFDERHGSSLDPDAPVRDDGFADSYGWQIETQQGIADENQGYEDSYQKALSEINKNEKSPEPEPEASPEPNREVDYER